jgi:hypothetical protein
MAWTRIRIQSTTWIRNYALLSESGFKTLYKGNTYQEMGIQKCRYRLIVTICHLILGCILPHCILDLKDGVVVGVGDGYPA